MARPCNAVMPSALVTTLPPDSPPFMLFISDGVAPHSHSEDDPTPPRPGRRGCVRPRRGFAEKNGRMKSLDANNDGASPFPIGETPPPHAAPPLPSSPAWQEKKEEKKICLCSLHEVFYFLAARTQSPRESLHRSCQFMVRFLRLEVAYCFFKSFFIFLNFFFLR